MTYRTRNEYVCDRCGLVQESDVFPDRWMKLNYTMPNKYIEVDTVSSYELCDACKCAVVKCLEATVKVKVSPGIAE